MADLTFLPWARAGAAGALNPAATSAGSNRPSFTVGLSATKTPDTGTPSTAAYTIPMTMLGPGDVTGITAGQVIRTEPADGSAGTATTLFPAVEFDDPTLPWLFTPATENPSHQLQPWICLVVVQAQDGVTLDTAARRLTIGGNADARRELPDLSEAWAWAHAQYAGDLPADPAAAAAAVAISPAAGLSRLICPRQLQPDTSYLACVVPTFMAGLQAGLGGNPDPGATASPAWDVRASGASSVTLPVYASFSFSTGSGGDFISLAQQLMHPPQVTAGPAAGLGPRTLTLPAAAQVPSLTMPGMLQPANAPVPPPLPASVTRWLQADLTPAGAMPQLRPTLYGAIQAGIRPRDLAGTGFGTLPGWWTTLNCDPRLRVAAALGRQVVAAEREQLVAAAWDQVAQAADVNAQLARAVSTRHADRHLPQGDALALLRLTSPQAGRVQLTVTPPPGAAAIVGSVWGIVRSPAADPRLAAGVSATYRRLSRPRGPHSRATPPPAPPPALIPAAQLRAQLNPAQLIANRTVSERLSPAAAALASPRADPLRALAPAVSFPFGMITPLVQLAQEAILPGAATIPANTALTLGTNPGAIAAYMVGLNTEISRLLLWRGVPCDRRATPFTLFWDVRGQQGANAGDIQPIAGWLPGSTLASEVGGSAELVLAIRADLLRRYPRTAVYAAPAVPGPVPGSHTIDPAKLVQPTFTASLPPDLALFGFSGITPAAAIGTPGYFFVLQEQATETRFGSDHLTAGASPPAGSHWTVAALGLPASPNAGTVADRVRMEPALVAIHARVLLPAPTSGA